MKVVALDYGEKRIGVAVAQTEVGVALPATVLPNDIERVVAWLRESGAERVVVGMPIHLWGAKSERAEQVERFIDALRTRLRVPIEIVDERFSTQEAERRLLTMEVRREKRKQVVDAVAAAILLETYLMRLQNESD
ncbi:MAG: Holliday junction resolvase RuvX [Fimbriimonadales bacterium]|jgi:putative Holliday junction resolvase|nr:Holliday junction resolvase RuvX [Fimbriimonadales bacterium]GIV11872.1 MAG: putative pre-16S rRNA nuclease [Fimbriimonadales bacterium]